MDEFEFRSDPITDYDVSWPLVSEPGFQCNFYSDLLISILPKNHAGTVEKLISDFFRMPKKVVAIDSL